MSEKEAKALRKLVKDAVSGYWPRHQMARGLRKHRETECPKINTKKLARRRRSLMAQQVRAAERRGVPLKGTYTGRFS